MPNKIKILNCSIDNLTRLELLDGFHSGVLVPVNVDMIVKMQKDAFFHECCSNATFVSNDSQILRAASRFLGTPLKETIPGSDFFPLFYTYHRTNEKVRIFLLGAMEGVGEKAMATINKKVDREIIVGTYSPPFGFEKDVHECKKIIDIINKSKATVLAIGLGAPKQEKWVFTHKDSMPHVKQFICIGATIDFEAGKIQRAPKFFRTIGLEWFYRLVKEPKRLWRRYLVDDISFFQLIIAQKFGFYKDPFSGKKNDS